MSLSCASRTFTAPALPSHVAEAVWRGSELGGAVARTIPSGFAALDGQLPGGGWPTHSLTELLMAQEGLYEWRLLGPALPSLMASAGRVYLVTPPRQPHAGGLAQLGLAPDQVVWIHAPTSVDRLWATEQIVKSDPAGAVLAWLPQARPEQVRRLQIHAQSCDAPVFVFRPVARLSDASPAPLRVTVAQAEGWHLEVRVPKRRGASFEGALHLHALPAHLAAVLPPRLKSLPAQPAALGRKEISDARILGRVAPSSLAGQHLPH